MATKNLTITEEAYENLKAHKREGESFTDTINRLTQADRDVMKGFGAFEDVDGWRESVEGVREQLDTDMRERQERLQRRRGRDE